MKKNIGIGLAMLTAAGLLIDSRCQERAGSDSSTDNQRQKTSNQVQDTLGKGSKNRIDKKGIEQENPTTLEWDGKALYSSEQIGKNVFAIYDFPKYVIFEYDMAVGKETKRMIIYARKGIKHETPIIITERSEGKTNMKAVSKQIPYLVFSGKYEGRVELMKTSGGNDGINITTVSSKNGTEENIERLLTDDYHAFWLKNNQ